ncbi:hypothetical protein ACQY1Q_17355 [Tenacibaculum sp. TC6]|uniref:hypothetical protein n=1 Tax=Tenacibaculum sp. TC6 TaxID=3423223 RepID=UPI003D36E3E1
MRNIKLIFIFLLVFTSCKNVTPNYTTDDTHEILQALFDYTTKTHVNFIAFPPKITPPSPNSNINSDSIKKLIELDRKIYKDSNNILNKYIRHNGRFIIGIDSILSISYCKDLKLKSCKTEEFKQLYDNLVSLDKEDSIDLTKIKDNKYSVIIPYQHYYEKTLDKGFEKYDFIFKFSRIAFNKQNTKAIVIMGVSSGRLNGFSTLFFLEKNKGTWHIICKQGVSLS